MHIYKTFAWGDFNKNNKLFFDEMIYFPLGKRYFWARVREERSGRLPRKKSKCSYKISELLHHPKLKIW